MTKRSRNQLLLGTALALSFAAAAAPAAANEVTPGEGEALARPIGPVDEFEAQDDAGPGGSIRPFDIEVRLEPMAAKGGKGGGSIRPFAGGILPNAGTIRSFAGPISGTAGTIRSFQGALTESAGTIRSFAGTIRSFAGTIRSFSGSTYLGDAPDASFWGTLTPQAGTIRSFAGTIRSFEGDLDVMAGTIRSFYGELRTSAGTIRSFDQAPTTYNGLRTEISKLVDRSRVTFGAAVQQQTGRSFDEAFVRRMLGKYGINLNDPRSLQGLNEIGYEVFLLDWYDNLMLYSGQDQVDHWMKQVNWTPALTQNLGAGADTKIGILDFGITGDEFANVTNSTLGHSATGVHGSAVASLIAAKHNGRGVMGIAPGATVFGYNPFDATNTAGWADVKAGVRHLLDNGASVINMSLGVSGFTLHSGWNDHVFAGDKALQDKAKRAVFVVAAGNDGIVHNKDSKVNWNFDTNPNIIIVGSVDPNNNISAFSNRPGEAQFNKIAGNDPLGTDKLRDRFMVAPGEWMLVSDGQGGVTRMSGTSFAAPLVSGTIALVHDRWPWLATMPKETVDLILNSTVDLGAPGTDDVYGRGMLDVQKALQPGNFWALKYTRYVDGVKRDMTAANVLETSATTLSSWQVANNVYFFAFEDLGDGKNAHRDFNIPVASKLIGQTVGTSAEQFDAYVRTRFIDWMNTNRRRTGFTSAQFSAPMAAVGGLETEAVAVPRTWRPGLRQSNVPFDTGLALRSEDGRFGFRFGSGAGATLTGQHGFGLQSDYDAATGGANPFMGLASGAGYGAIELAIGPRLKVSTGLSRQNAVLDFDRMNPRERQILGGMDPYRATANNMTVTYTASDRFSANFGYTLLNEDSGLLGVRSIDPTDLRGGSDTDAATFGADYKAAKGLMLSVSGTMGRTRPGGGSQGIVVSDGGIISSAWQVALAKEGVLDGNDRLRLSFAQPLHMEKGAIDLSMAAVIDRTTGDIGEIVQTAQVGSGRRTFVAEAIYGRGFADGAGSLNLFGRANLRSEDQAQPALTLGGNIRFGF